MCSKKRYSARIMLLPTELGGRISAAASGYQPALKIGEEYTSVKILAQDSTLELFELGIVYPVYIELIFQEQYVGRIENIRQVILAEGSKVVGVGMFI